MGGKSSKKRIAEQEQRVNEISKRYTLDSYKSDEDKAIRLTNPETSIIKTYDEFSKKLDSDLEFAKSLTDARLQRNTGILNDYRRVTEEEFNISKKGERTTEQQQRYDEGLQRIVKRQGEELYQAYLTHLRGLNGEALRNRLAEFENKNIENYSIPEIKQPFHSAMHDYSDYNPYPNLTLENKQDIAKRAAEGFKFSQTAGKRRRHKNTKRRHKKTKKTRRR
jgi:hypothetical protein